jgi:hypothetical protein
MCSTNHLSWDAQSFEINRLSLVGSQQVPTQEAEHADADMGAVCSGFTGSTREASWLATTTFVKN